MKNYIVLIAPICGWAIAQTIKYLISFRKDGFQLSDFTQSGGFPSSHASFVVSLTTIIAFAYGLDSIYFAICAAFTAIILYDTIGVRRTTGEQTEVIDKIIEKQHLKVHKTIHQSKGHSLSEMIAGVLLGIGVGFVLHYFF